MNENTTEAVLYSICDNFLSNQEAAYTVRLTRQSAYSFQAEDYLSYNKELWMDLSYLF